MGVTTRTVTVCTCDVCQRECQPDEGRITIEVNGGDGRDVGPATISGMLTFHQPYGCDKGVVCRACKIKWLRRYVDAQATPTGVSA